MSLDNIVLTDKIWFYIIATVKGSHIYNCYYY